MQSRISILFDLLLLVPLIIADETLKCRELDEEFNICEKDNALVYINETSPCVWRCQRHLHIYELNVTSIAPNAFRNLAIHDLRMSFQGNSVELKPESFEGLPDVKTLVISSAIISLDENTFKALPLVTHFHLRDCSIVELKKGAFSAFPNLEFVGLTTNISTINPDTFYGTGRKMYHLFLSDNNISVLKPNSFESFENLFTLDLSYNRLTDLEPGVFNGLNKLNNLRLRENQLKTIQKNVFNNLNRILSLDLRENRISIIETGAFNGPSIADLDLRYNQLTDNSSESFKEANISDLRLWGNDNITDASKFLNGHSQIDIYRHFRYWE